VLGGVAVLRDGEVLGVAIIGLGVAVLRSTGVFVPFVTWLASLTKAPKR